ncbi:hypothetical protein [uncultured Stenotrophomonas sp.]|uniref:hypothetical protein n=1 Tax=uncultured Stenotrophomonas sp. TaxID=165438 RepID=UPI0025F50DDC|nr:hypothetical protein [uncultured Stenotrophomonas sp.]
MTPPLPIIALYGASNTSRAEAGESPSRTRSHSLPSLEAVANVPTVVGPAASGMPADPDVYYLNGRPVADLPQLRADVARQPGSVRRFVDMALQRGLLSRYPAYRSPSIDTTTGWPALEFQLALPEPANGSATLHVLQQQGLPAGLSEDSSSGRSARSGFGWPWNNVEYVGPDHATPARHRVDSDVPPHEACLSPEQETDWRLQLDADGSISVNGSVAGNIHCSDQGARVLHDLLCAPVEHRADATGTLLQTLSRYHALLVEAHAAYLDEGLPASQRLDADAFRLLFHRQQLAHLAALATAKGENDLGQRLLARLQGLHGQLVDPHEYLSDLTSLNGAIGNDVLPFIEHLLTLHSPLQTAREMYLATAGYIGAGDVLLNAAASIEQAHQQVRDALAAQGLPTSCAQMPLFSYQHAPHALPLHLQLAPASPAQQQARRQTLALLIDELEQMRRRSAERTDGHVVARLLLEPAAVAGSGVVAPARVLSWLQLARGLHAQGVVHALPAELIRFALSELQDHLRHNPQGLARARLIDLLLPSGQPSSLLANLDGLPGVDWDQARLAGAHLLAETLRASEMLEATHTGHDRHWRLFQLRRTLLAGPWERFPQLLPKRSLRGWELPLNAALPVLPEASAQGASGWVQLLEHARSLHAFGHTTVPAPVSVQAPAAPQAAHPVRPAPLDAHTAPAMTVSLVPPQAHRGGPVPRRTRANAHSAGQLHAPVPDRIVTPLRLVTALTESEAPEVRLVRKGTVDDIRYYAPAEPLSPPTERIRLGTLTADEQRAAEDISCLLLEGGHQEPNPAVPLTVDAFLQARASLGTRDVSTYIPAPILEQIRDDLQQDRQDRGLVNDAWRVIERDVNRDTYFINGEPITTPAQLRSHLADQPDAVASFVIHAAHQGLWARHEFSIHGQSTVFEDAVDGNHGALLLPVRNEDRKAYRITLPSTEGGTTEIHATRHAPLRSARPFPREAGGDDGPALADSELHVDLTLRLQPSGTVVIEGHHAMRLQYADGGISSLRALLDLPGDVVPEQRIGALQRYQRWLQDQGHRQQDALPTAPRPALRDAPSEALLRTHLHDLAKVMHTDASAVADRMLDSLFQFDGALIDPELYLRQLFSTHPSLTEMEKRAIAWRVRSSSPYATAVQLYLVAGDLAGRPVMRFAPAAGPEQADASIQRALSSWDLPVTPRQVAAFVPQWNERGLPLRLQLDPDARSVQCLPLLQRAAAMASAMHTQHRAGASLAEWLLQPDESSGLTHVRELLNLAVTLHAAGVRTALPDEMARFALATLDAGLRMAACGTRRRAALVRWLCDEVQDEQPLLQLLAQPAGLGWSQARAACSHLLYDLLHGPAPRGAAASRVVEDVPPRLLRALDRARAQWPGLDQALPRPTHNGRWRSGRGGPLRTPLHVISEQHVDEHLELLQRHAWTVQELLRA